MKHYPKLRTSLGILLLGASVCLGDRSTLDETKTQVALPMSTPPTIDGDFSATEWQQAGGSTGVWKVSVKTVTPEEGDPYQVIVGGGIGDAGTVPENDADLSYQVFAGYDADYLYVAVRVKDSIITTDSAAESSANGTTWMDDSVEIFVDGDNSNYPSRDTSGNNPSVVGSGGQFVITANNAYRDAEAGSPGYGEDKAWYAQTKLTADGYDAEFRISLRMLGNPKPGDIVGFTVGVNDDDNGGEGERQVIWVGRPHTECTYGNLVLGQKSYTAPQVATAPTVDGVILPEEYAGAQEIRLDETSGLSEFANGFARSDLSYRAWVIHDADAVYVAVDVTDDQIFTDTAAAGTEDGTTWEDDSIELFFDPTNNKNQGRTAGVAGTGQYVFTANGAWRDAEANNPTFGEDADWFAATKRTFKGYQVEFKVKKAGLQSPADGASMGFNVCVNDDDGAGRKSQLNWDGDPHHEFTYGSLTLGGPAVVPTEPPGRKILDETKTQVALPMSTPPTIDGDFSATEWQQAGGSTGVWKVSVKTVTPEEGDPYQVIVGGGIGDAGTVPENDADLSYQVFAGYDADYLYVAVRVKDSIITTDSATESSANGTTWMDDSVEIFVDGDNSNYPSRDTSGNNPSVVGSGGQFVITANNAYRDAEAGSPGYGEDKAWYAQTKLTADGYDAEFRISLKTLGNPKPGDIVGFTVGVNDDDNGGEGERQVIWVGRPHTECTYGNLVLGQKSYTAPQVATAPTVDGVILPEEYAGAQEIRLDETSGLSEFANGFARSDLSYRAWVIHDADAVYVAVDVTDDQIFTDTAAAGTEDGTTWEDDSIELFFDPTNNKNQGRTAGVAGTGQYVFTANGAWRDAEANNPTFGEDADWFAATKRTFKGYQVEFKVKKAGLQSPADGASMGFNVCVNDDDGAGRKSQLNWDGDPHHEFTYGSLMLGTSVGGGSLKITAVESVGANLKLTFTTSVVGGTFVVKSASNITTPQWSDVGGVTFGAGAGGSLTATFPKPAVKAQFYRISGQ